MQLPIILRTEIVEFLQSLPDVHSAESRRALIGDAGLDLHLQNTLPFEKPPAEFFSLLVDSLSKYGQLCDGRPALEAVLETARKRVGRDKNEQCDGLIKQLHALQKAAGNSLTTLQPSIYQNIPQPDWGQFIGRIPESTKIKQLLRPYPHSQHAIVTIRGIGGIGKSALALEIAHYYLRNCATLQPEERFDAIIWASAKRLYLDAEGITERHRNVPRNLADIYSIIGITLQREDINWKDTDNRNEIVRHALTQQRTLLIVDNLEAVDDEEVMMFLRELPAPTKAIVTTRYRIDVAYSIHLHEMDWDDSIKLIQQECQKKDVVMNEEESRLLYTRTGGVPLAIVWSVGQMGLGNPPARVLESLKGPNEAVRYCFMNVIEQIKGTPAHTLLLIFALCGSSISRECLGQVAGLSEIERDDGLMELERLSLVNKRANRFNLLPLTKRLVVGEFWQYPDKQKLEDTWVTYFAEKCRQYSRAYWGWVNYDWLIAEGDNICTIVDHALTLHKEKTALSFAHPLILYLDITGREIELKEYSEALYFLAQITKDKPLQAWFNVYVFGWYVPPGEEEQAEQCVSKGLQLYDELNDKKGMWFAMTRLGRIARMMGTYDVSERYYTAVLKEAQAHNFAYGIADVYFGLGNLAIAQQDWESARRYFEQVIEWCEKEDDNEERADISFWQTTCSKLGWVEYNLGHYHRGRELLEESLLFLKQIGGKRNFINVHLRLARVEDALGNSAAAAEHGQQALFWAERLGIQQKHKEAIELLSEIVGEIDREE